MTFLDQKDLKLHVLTQKRLKITFFDPKLTSNDRFLPQKTTFQENHPVRHSNGLYLVRLNPSHEIFEKFEHIELSFQITEKTNRCDNKVSGKRKLNGQWIDQTGTLAILKCINKSKVEGESDEVRVIKMMSPVKGKLFQVNKRLNVEGDQKSALRKRVTKGIFSKKSYFLWVFIDFFFHFQGFSLLDFPL